MKYEVKFKDGQTITIKASDFNCNYEENQVVFFRERGSEEYAGLVALESVLCIREVDEDSKT